MQFPIDRINLDASTQCRASINTDIVDEYAGRMKEGDEFPAVVLFGTEDEAWIGDGWHRVLAARQIGEPVIRANLLPGGRREAIETAIKANQVHGLRRTNADKRRCVEIALKEFPDLSSRQIAELCGVSNHMVDDVRPRDVGESPTSPRTDTLGRKQPAKKPKRATQFPPDEKEETTEEVCRKVRAEVSAASDEERERLDSEARNIIDAGADGPSNVDDSHTNYDKDEQGFEQLAADCSAAIDGLALLKVPNAWRPKFVGRCKLMSWRLEKISRQ